MNLAIADETPRPPQLTNAGWVIQGTNIRIVDIQIDARYSERHARNIYGSMGVTRDEFDAALRFNPPSLISPDIFVNLLDATMRCSCGTTQRIVQTGLESNIVDCPCGARWQVIVSLAPDS